MSCGPPSYVLYVHAHMHTVAHAQMSCSPSNMLLHHHHTFMHGNQYLPAPLTIPHSPTLPQAVLLQELREVERLLKRESSLPLNPAVRVKGLNLDKCSFFSSFTVPLKLSFKCGEGRPDVGVIFKVGVGHSGINTHVVRCYCTWSTC